MPKKSQVFSIQIPVKPYVKKFIEDSYGSPTNFAHFPEMNVHFQSLLKNPTKHRDGSLKENICPYPDILEVIISEDDFYRYGWELTKTDIITFGKYYENRVKFFMRNFVGLYIALGLPIFCAIRRFQDKFNFSEDDWKYEAIKKDFYRNGSRHDLDFNEVIFNKLEKITLDNLYDLGTLSRNIKKQYENNRKAE